ncbi:MAG TPA: DinB family protein [Vicinamibacterales bacterium]|nr:DinB family protein [Vicinamibacterales bacterium]
MNRHQFSEYLQQMEWADALTWRAARPLPQTDERLRYLFHHIHVVQHVYLQAWRGDPFAPTELSSYTDLASIEAWARSFHATAREFAATVDESRFDQPVAFPWAAMITEQFGAGVTPATFAESAFQVFTHTIYHRGQIAMRVRELGGVPPTVDYLVWVWSGKPAAQW